MHHDTDVDWLLERCSEATSFTGLLTIAKIELCKFPKGAEIVCGPMSTGGVGSLEENMRVFENTIKTLMQQAAPVFNQIPYQDKMVSLVEEWSAADGSRAGKYCMPILEEFYSPLFETGFIKKAWFIPGWESSIGATWERKKLSSVGVRIYDLGDSWIRKITVP